MQMKSVLQKTSYLFRESFNEFIADNAMKLSASLSYYTIFSLPPLLIVIINLCGFIFGREAVSGELFGQINGLVGNEAAMQIQEAIRNVHLAGGNTFASVIGVIFLLIGASGVFAEIQDSINHIWGIKPKPKKGLIKFIKNRLMSFSMIGSVGFLLMVGLIINTLLDIISERLSDHLLHDTFYLYHTLNMLILFIIITILFMFIYKTLPDGKIAFRDCAIGAAFTSFLFMVGKFAIGAYLGSSMIASWYGAAGSVILILVWVYYSAIILYFGAEFTKVYAITHGDKIVPNEYSVLVVSKKIEIE